MIEREIFSFFFSSERKKERKRERDAFSSVAIEIPLYLLSSFSSLECISIIIIRQSTLHYNKTLLYYNMLASTSGGALFFRSMCSLSFC